MFRLPNKYRCRTGNCGSTDDYGNNMLFYLPNPYKKSLTLKVIASNSEGWEHVSVSTVKRCPFWAEMCYVKGLFWDDEDCVVQYHPPKSAHVNCHPYCLHLWRSTTVVFPSPPIALV